MGMFGSPFGNFSPVNGIVLPGDTMAQKIAPKQAAAGMIPTPQSKPPASGGGGTQRLRSNMLRSPELTLATSGRLRCVRMGHVRYQTPFVDIYGSMVVLLTLATVSFSAQYPY